MTTRATPNRRLIPLFLSTLLLASTATAEVLSDDWYTTTIQNRRVGYYHVIQESQPGETGEVIVRTEEMRFTLLRERTEITVESKAIYVETARAEPLRFESTHKMAAQDYSIKAERRGEHFVVTQTAMGKTTETEVPFSSDIIFPYTIEREIEASAMLPGRELVVRTFSADLARPTRMKINCVAREEVEIGGRKQQLRRFESTQDLVPSVVLTEWRDADGHVLRTKLPIAGLDIISTRSSRLEALLPAESVELLVSTMVDPAEYLPQPRHVDLAVFRLRLLQPSDGRTLEVPEDSRQKIIGREDQVVVIEVKREDWGKGDAAAIPRPPYRAASSVLQTDDPKVIALAAEAGGKGGSPAEVARRISTWVYRAIEKKNLSVGLATASEVARDLTGDCTEHAVLAAALARARGIPSKVAMGLVYLNGVFGYHMWTEVYDDGWHAIDPALGQEAIDATHIKLAESPLDQGFVDEAIIGMINVIANLDIRVVRYEANGKVFDSGHAKGSGSLRAGKYRNTLLGLSINPPDGWRLLPSEPTLQHGTLVRLEGPEGVRGELVATPVSPDYRLSTWFQTSRAGRPVAKDSILAVAEQHIRRMLLGGASPEALIAFVDRDTLYAMRLKPVGKLAARSLDDLVRSIQVTKN